MNEIRRTFIGTLPFHGTWGTTLETCPWTKIISWSRPPFQNVVLLGFIPLKTVCVNLIHGIFFVWVVSPWNFQLLFDDTGFPDSFMSWLTGTGVAVVNILHWKMMIIMIINQTSTSKSWGLLIKLGRRIHCMREHSKLTITSINFSRSPVAKEVWYVCRAAMLGAWTYFSPFDIATASTQRVFFGQGQHNC